MLSVRSRIWTGKDLLQFFYPLLNPLSVCVNIFMKLIWRRQAQGHENQYERRVQGNQGIGVIQYLIPARYSLLFVKYAK